MWYLILSFDTMFICIGDIQVFPFSFESVSIFRAFPSNGIFFFFYCCRHPHFRLIFPCSMCCRTCAMRTIHETRPTYWKKFFLCIRQTYREGTILSTSGAFVKKTQLKNFLCKTKRNCLIISFNCDKFSLQYNYYFTTKVIN